MDVRPRDITLYFDDGNSMAIRLAGDHESRLALLLLDRAHWFGEPVTLRVVDNAGQLTRCTVDGARLAGIVSSSTA
jgi:hypothetical protein